MNEREAPFALLYKAEHDVGVLRRLYGGLALTQPDADRSQGSSKREPVLSTSRLTLVSTVGVPIDHPSAPKEVEFHLARDTTRSNLSPTANHINSSTLSAIATPSTGSHRLVADETPSVTSWPFKKALITKRCVLVNDVSQLTEGYTPRAFGTLPKAAILIPICSDSATDLPSTVLILGLHPRSPLDNSYEDWLVSVLPMNVWSTDAIRGRSWSELGYGIDSIY